MYRKYFEAYRFDQVVRLIKILEIALRTRKIVDSTID